MLLIGVEEKEPFLNTPDHSVLNKACPQVKLFYQSLTSTGVLPDLR